jgi:DNA modification methylase
MFNYKEFLEDKKITVKPSGFEVDESKLNPMLYDYQKDIVRFALRAGKFLLLQDCGLGKTPEQLEWAHHVNEYTDKPVLIIAPLGVTMQTVRESEKFNRQVKYIRLDSEIDDQSSITNYEMLKSFLNTSDWYGGIIFDESSIFKGLGNRTLKLAKQLVDNFDFRLCCSATPSPNDYDELLRQAEILGIMPEKEAKAMFFTQDGASNKWKLSKWADKGPFWDWCSGWMIAMRKPSDLGYSDDTFVRAGNNLVELVVKGKEYKTSNQMSLFPVQAKGMTERRRARKVSVIDRVSAIAELVNNPDKMREIVPDYVDGEPIVIWRKFLAEADEVCKQMPLFVDIRGSLKRNEKEKYIIQFSDGEINHIVTDPSMFGHGMNWQHARIQFFLGLSDSYEEYYQAMRRLWRNGQTRDVYTFWVYADTEGNVIKNINRKQQQHDQLYDRIVKRMARHYDASILDHQIEKDEMEYKVDYFESDDYKVFLGDSAEMLEQVENDSIHLTVTSTPFAGLNFAYSNSMRDVGNSKDGKELTNHLSFIMRQVYRVTMPGRLACVELMAEPLFKWRNGHTGRIDFRGDVIRMMQDLGWIWHSEVVVTKDPQLKAGRTHDSGLTQASVHKDMCRAAPVIDAYVLIFRKPGENLIPVKALDSAMYQQEGWIPMYPEDGPASWVELAHGYWMYDDPDMYLPLPNEVWTDIKESGVLKWDENGSGKGKKQVHTLGRDDDDDRHLAPMQLETVRRLIRMYSNPEETVLDPFSGQGTTGFCAIEQGRKYTGCELKPSYWELSERVLKYATKQANQRDLFTMGMTE